MDTRIFLLDDHHLFRVGLRSILAAEPGFTVVGEASEASSAHALIDAEHPDVIITDVSLPGTSGVEFARALLRRRRTCKVLVLTMHATPELAVEALAAGVQGYATKDESPASVIEAVRSVGRGRLYVSPRIPRTAIEEHLRLREGRAAPSGTLVRLSPREREIFDMTVRGYTNEKMAGMLGISLKTVQTHRAKINDKLGVHSPVELVRFAARRGLLFE